MAMKAKPLLSLAKAISLTALQRVRKGPRRPEWSIPFEAMVGQMSGLRARTERLAVTEQRTAWEATAPPNTIASRVTVTKVDGAPVPSRWCTAKARSMGGPVVLYLHGGAFCFGSFRTHGELVSRIALASGARVFFPDYRLAPEHPFPAGLEDAIASYEYLLRTEDPSRIVVAGDSAGGNLAAELLLHVRDAKLPAPAGGALLCPWVDVTENASSEPTDDWTSGAWAETFRAAYLGEHPPADPRVSPINADLAGLSPLFVQAGSAELLAPQIDLFVEKAKKAGVDVTYDLAQGMVHTYQMFAALHSPSRDAIDEIARFVHAAAWHDARRRTDGARNRRLPSRSPA